MMVSMLEEEPGRRERKKQRTREALIDAAFTLFMAKGFDATTVEEIADAVDVSSRTFFRYFASKEEVALTVQDEQLKAVVAALAARPLAEPVVTAMRQAMVDTVRAGERGEMGFDLSRAECVVTMTSNSHTMMARSLAHAQKKQAELTEVIAARMGVDPAEDLRPHLAAAMASCAFRAVGDMMTSQPGRYTSLADAVDDAFAILELGVNFPSADGTCCTQPPATPSTW